MKAAGRGSGTSRSTTELVED